MYGKGHVAVSKRRPGACGLTCLIGILSIGICPLLAAPDGDAPIRRSAAASPARFGSSPVQAIADRIKLDLNRPAPGRVEPADSPKTEDSDPAPPERPHEGSEDDPSSSPATPAKPAAKAAKPGDKSRLQALEAEAQQCKVADEALLLYKSFLQDPETTAEEKELAQPRLAYWEQAAGDELVRMGKKWIPRAEADKLKEEADKLVADAIGLIELQSFKKAEEKLERASRICPDHLESLFLLGVGGLLSGDIKGADKRFTQCLGRAPNHVPLLNDAALCAALTKRYERAVNLWEKAAALEPDNADIAQNIAQFIADATRTRSSTKAEKAKLASDITKAKARGRIHIDVANVDRRLLDDAMEIYAKILDGGKVDRADPTGGYIIMKLFQSK